MCGSSQEGSGKGAREVAVLQAWGPRLQFFPCIFHSVHGAQLQLQYIADRAHLLPPRPRAAVAALWQTDVPAAVAVQCVKCAIMLKESPALPVQCCWQMLAEVPPFTGSVLKPGSHCCSNKLRSGLLDHATGMRGAKLEDGPVL